VARGSTCAPARSKHLAVGPLAGRRPGEAPPSSLSVPLVAVSAAPRQPDPDLHGCRQKYGAVDRRQCPGNCKRGGLKHGFPLPSTFCRGVGATTGASKPGPGAKVWGPLGRGPRRARARQLRRQRERKVSRPQHRPAMPNRHTLPRTGHSQARYFASSPGSSSSSRCCATRISLHETADLDTIYGDNRAPGPAAAPRRDRAFCRMHPAHCMRRRGFEDTRESAENCERGQGPLTIE